MQLGNFEFIPFIKGMFDGKEQGAVFVFKHVKTNSHYACRYWDASRFNGEGSYPMSLINFLSRFPSEVEVYVLPMVSKSRRSGEVLMDKVVDILTEQKLYRGVPSRTRGGKSVIDAESNYLVAMVHRRTNIFRFSTIRSTHDSAKRAALTGLCVWLNGIVLGDTKDSEVTQTFVAKFGPFSADDWEIAVLDANEKIQTSKVPAAVEKISIAAIRDGQCVINRIRTHSPLWYFNNQYRGKNITATEYIELGSTGKLANGRTLQNPDK